MSSLKRFGVSVEEDLLQAFDDLCASKSYENRSEAIRDLIRQSINEAKWGESGQGAGTLTLIYDHHKHDVARKLIAIQHEYHDVVVACAHVHLDHCNCLEVLILKGDSDKVRNLSQKLISCKGVAFGVFNPVPTGCGLS